MTQLSALPPAPSPAITFSEQSMLDLLRKRHAAKKQGVPEWAYMEKVRNASGFDATRTADAMALGLWPSRGNELHGFEVKISRADWRRELNDPDKAEGWFKVVDRWWVVAPKGIVPVDELPAGWGLLETDPKGAKLIVKVQAALIQTERVQITRSLLVPMLRAAGAALEHTPDQAAMLAAEERRQSKGRRTGKAIQWRLGADVQQRKGELRS